MVHPTHLLASLGLTTAHVLKNPRQAVPPTVHFPDTTSNFAKDSVPATWAPGQPKAWGSEDWSITGLSPPDPTDKFGVTITDDEKYLLLSNGSHIQFTNLDTRTPIKIFPANGGGPWTRSRAEGGYDVFLGGRRQRVDASLTLIGGVDDLAGGGIGAVSPQGRLAMLSGQIYDLDVDGAQPIAQLEVDAAITGMSFAPDGVHLASVGWTAETADLWNATSGKKIFQFPATHAQNWLVRFSPDGAYIAIVLGSSNSSVQIYTLADLTSPPVEIKGFNDWPREMTWRSPSELAVGDTNRLQVFSIPSMKVLQKWEVTSAGWWRLPHRTEFLDGGRKVSWMWRQGQYLYDYETNTEWLWTPRVTDQIWGGEGFYFLKKRGYAVTVNGDSTVRFWKI